MMGALVTAIAALLLNPVRSTAQLSLSTVVTLAQRNSTTVRLSEADERKAEAQLAEQHDIYFPVFNLNAGLPVAPSVGFTGGVPAVVNATVQSQIFSLPQIQYDRAAKAGLAAAKLNLKNVREQVALEASTAYIELDAVTRELEAANQQAEFAQRLVEIEQQRSEAGIDSLSVYLDARLSAANIKYKLIHLESRRNSLVLHLATLTGLPAATMQTKTSSIPEIPRLSASTAHGPLYALESVHEQARSKRLIAKGDKMNLYSPQVGFNLQYIRTTTLLNDFNYYYLHPIPTNNFGAEVTFEIPFINLTKRGKSRESAADSLRAKVQLEQAEQQNDLNIATISDNLRELDVVSEIAELKKQIAAEKIKTVDTELNVGNGASSTAQANPSTMQLARIDERDKFIDAEDADFELNKARLNLLEALGHMDDWLHLIDSTEPPNAADPVTH